MNKSTESRTRKEKGSKKREKRNNGIKGKGKKNRPFERALDILSFALR
jgi:hypothetical protein